MARFRHLLRSLLSASGEPASDTGRHDAASDRGVDNPKWLAMASTRHPVACVTVATCSTIAMRNSAPPSTICCGAAVSTDSPAAEPESERIRRALGTFRQGRMPLQADPVWRIFATPSVARVHRPFSFRAGPSTQEEPPTIPFSSEDNDSPKRPLPRTPLRFT
jgi:hypothetical protein